MDMTLDFASLLIKVVIVLATIPMAAQLAIVPEHSSTMGAGILFMFLPLLVLTVLLDLGRLLRRN
ncbi:hypothetical protein QO207_25240 [Pseudomonas sp. CAN2814]|uniref:hypothetical protein n=1 Tax=Pseudomonas sp. CAN1 TaxID=3046726 RepID=UPI002648DE96|nr:hypothetical protein [Pseudomonas sp. CAN1]MDN6859907.1 hypothetical protein [Pseudomonas sp. CAN1]